MCNAPASVVFDFMRDGHKLGRWALGCFDTVEQKPGLYRGISLIDQQEVWVRSEAIPTVLAVSYHVGASPDDLKPRILAQVVPGDMLGRSAQTSVLSLIAWREASMDDDRWQQLRDSHRVELRIIRNLIHAEARQCDEASSAP